MNLRPIVRTSVGVATAAALAVLLAACGSSSNSSNSSQNKPSASASASTSSTFSANGTVPASTCAKYTSGPASKAVTVSGAYNATPSIKIAGKPTLSGIERTVITTGKGAMPNAADTANVHLTLFNASGTKIGVQDSQATLSNATSKFLTAALMCSPYGSRVVVVASASDIYGSNLPSILKATDTLYLVSDIVSKYGPAAWTTQVPKVTFNAKGVPTVKLVGSPMKTWAMKVLSEGTGAVVKSGDNVTLNYQGTNWDTHKMFEQSFGSQPISGSSFIPGFTYAMVGQKVGTKLIVTIPPALGYGVKTSKSNAQAGHTLVFVIQIVSTSSN